MEKNIKISEHLLKENNITTGKDSPVVSLSVAALGVLFFVVAAVLKNSSGAYTALLFLGFLFLVAGVAMFFMRQTVYKHQPTGEIMKKSTLYFSDSQRNELEHALENGDFEKLRNLSDNNSTLPLMLELYCSKSNRCAMYQLYRYVPHYYEPLGEVKFFIQ